MSCAIRSLSIARSSFREWNRDRWTRDRPWRISVRLPPLCLTCFAIPLFNTSFLYISHCTKDAMYIIKIVLILILHCRTVQPPALRSRDWLEMCTRRALLFAQMPSFRVAAEKVLCLFCWQWLLCTLKLFLLLLLR